MIAEAHEANYGDHQSQGVGGDFVGVKSSTRYHSWFFGPDSKLRPLVDPQYTRGRSPRRLSNVVKTTATATGSLFLAQ